MLIIRLQRVGKKNQASFRIVLAEKHRAAKKQVLEVLGYYNPRSKDFGMRDQERVEYWFNQHVEVSPTVRNLFISKGLLITGSKVQAWRPKKKAVAEPAAASDQEKTAIDSSAETKVVAKATSGAAAAEAPPEQPVSAKPEAAPQDGNPAPVSATDKSITSEN